ncbi:hypothetical protein FXO37_08818 [Capsicum annuum]|nr:hypothetical protein FXO37_08818 [Capsicum annuum]
MLSRMESSFLPLQTTGRVCLKSPPSTTTFKPNNIFESIISFKRESNASIIFFFAIDTSSHTINFASRIKDASKLFLLILQENFSSILIGILKCECVVLPPGRIKAATPKVVIANAINPLDLTVANKAQYKNVLPLSPGPSMKNAPGLFVNIL